MVIQNMAHGEHLSVSLEIPYFLSVAYRGGVGVFKNPPHEIPKALQNCAKLNPI